MVELGYERISHILAIASIAPDDACMQSLQLRENEVTDREIVISFQNYVKSQLCYYISCKVSKQSFLTYVRAFHYLEGERQYEKEANELLRCFYTDIAAFLLHSAVDLKVHLNVEMPGLTEWHADLGKIESELSELFVFGASPTESFKKFLDVSEYAWVFDFISDVQDGKDKIHNYTFAAALLDMLQDKKNYKFVEVSNEISTK